MGTTFIKPLLLWKYCCKPRGLLLHLVILLHEIAVLWLRCEYFLVLMVLEHTE